MATVPYMPLPMEQDDVEYDYGPDSTPQDDVQPGRQIQFSIDDPAHFPGTHRRVTMHIPEGVDVERPTAVTVVLDGTWYLDSSGAFRAGLVIDNLVARRGIPPMVGVFVDPGVFPHVADEDARKNRNFEYDSADDHFANFLADEVLPRVSEHLTMSTHPAHRAICGGSSGGNAAFTAAWHRPDIFGRVLALGPSFAQITGGNPYLELIAECPRKPMRVLISAAHRDLQWNEAEDNWFAENLAVAASLARAGYDMRLVLREGGHSMTNGGALLPDALRWLWMPGWGDSRHTPSGPAAGPTV